MYEYSPASVLARLPPAMCWLNAMFCAIELDPGSPVKKRNATDASAKNAGAGRGARIPRANTYAPTGRRSGPVAVASLNAMLYGRTRSRKTVISAGTGK